MNVLTVLLFALSILLALPAVLLLLQILLATYRQRPRPQTSGSLSIEQVAQPQPSVVVLVPAHNEASGLSATLDSVIAQLRPHDRVLVVADNCHDDTAAVARAMGVFVAERRDPNTRGKSYALDFGVRHISSWEKLPQVVIIVDADCVLDKGSLELLAATAVRKGCPAQALYLMHAPIGASLKVRIAEFAWIVKNRVRPSGFLALGLPCQLMGSGMAFPWALLRDAPLATGNLVEDLKLGADLAKLGCPPIFCPAATVHSQFPSSETGLMIQRKRWEQGHLHVIAHEGVGLILKAVGRRDISMLAMGLDMCVPPLASLVLMQIGLLVATLLVGIAGASLGPFFIGMLGAGALSTAVMLAWYKYGRSVVTARELTSIPKYIGMKIGILHRYRSRKNSWLESEHGAIPKGSKLP